MVWWTIRLLQQEMVKDLTQFEEVDFAPNCVQVLICIADRRKYVPYYEYVIYCLVSVPTVCRRKLNATQRDSATIRTAPHGVADWCGYVG